MSELVIVGASSYVGKALCSYFNAKGVLVYGMDTTNPNIKGVVWYPIQTDENFQYRYMLSRTPIINVPLIGLSYPKQQGRTTERLLRMNITKPFIHISLSSECNYKTTPFTDLNIHAEGCPFLRAGGTEEAAVHFSHKYRKYQPVILRPHNLYGSPESDLEKFFHSSEHDNTLVLPEGGQSLSSFTHLKNLTQAVDVALRCKSRYVETFDITDANPVPVADAARMMLHNPYLKVTAPDDTGTPLQSVPENALTEFSCQVELNRVHSIKDACKKLHYNPSDFKVD